MRTDRHADLQEEHNYARLYAHLDERYHLQGPHALRRAHRLQQGDASRRSTSEHALEKAFLRQFVKKLGRV